MNVQLTIKLSKNKFLKLQVQGPARWQKKKKTDFIRNHTRFTGYTYVHCSGAHWYFCQLQGQLALCNVFHCDFVCWVIKGIFVERIEKDHYICIYTAFSLHQLFLTKYLLLEPQISTPWLWQGDWCLLHVQKPESGRKIACSNPKCGIAWFTTNWNLSVKRALREK